MLGKVFVLIVMSEADLAVVVVSVADLTDVMSVVV